MDCHRCGADGDGFGRRLGPDPLATGEPGAFLPFVGDLAHQRAIVEADAVCGDCVAKELMRKGFFARTERAGAGGEQEQGEEEGDSHGPEFMGCCGIVRGG